MSGAWWSEGLPLWAKPSDSNETQTIMEIWRLRVHGPVPCKRSKRK